MYASNAQRAFFHAASARGDMPRKVVREFDEATPRGASLPEHKAYGGEVCPHCGGDMPSEGSYSEGGEVEHRPPDRDERNRMFMLAIRRRRE